MAANAEVWHLRPIGGFLLAALVISLERQRA
jgi:hypothetical protein